jgi:CTP:molybdopterin cytidylyltransferase MocA
MGTPKGLLRSPDGVPFVDRAVGALFDGGCDVVVVVVGAAADEVTSLLDEAGWAHDDGVSVVLAGGWEEGMGASLRAGLTRAEQGDATAALVTLVDLPDVGAAVVRRLLDGSPLDADVLARAAYRGVPGHPVLLGRSHWPGVVRSAAGDRGARDYLVDNRPTLVECGDLATGRDVDRPEHLPT